MSCHSGMVQRTRPGISRFRVRCFASPGMTPYFGSKAGLSRRFWQGRVQRPWLDRTPGIFSPLPLRERSDRIARCHRGEGPRPLVRPWLLSRIVPAISSRHKISKRSLPALSKAARRWYIPLAPKGVRSGCLLRKPPDRIDRRPWAWTEFLSDAIFARACNGLSRGGAAR